MESNYLDLVSRPSRIGVTLGSPTPKLVASKSINEESRSPIVRGEVLTSESRKGSTLVPLGGTVRMNLHDNPKRARNSHDIPPGEMQIGNIHAARDPVKLWGLVCRTSNEAKAVRTLAEILLDKEGRTFIANLTREDAELCIEILDYVSRGPYPLSSHHLRLFCQGLARYNLETAEKQAFFVTLRRLATIHGRLPESMVITKKIAVTDKILASGGFADIRTGKYVGHVVAVREIRVPEQDNILKIRKVSIDDIFQLFGVRL